MARLKVNHVQKVATPLYSHHKTTVLQDVSFSVEDGEYVALLGESGSGKSALLKILGLMDVCNNGRISLRGDDLTRLSEEEIPGYRRDHMGLIFPDFRLIESLSIRDNVCFPLVMGRIKSKTISLRVQKILDQMELSEVADRMPYEVSDAQKQRTALARALVIQPDILLADEPTWRLRSNETKEFLDLLDLFHKRGQTILVATHSSLVASRAQRVLFIRDGRVHQEMVRQGSYQVFYSHLVRTFEDIHREDAYDE